ncbi:MAG TPA: hypothetical protein VNR18_03425 [Hyphomicrobiales bacterium]|nr:hypothetical protein [Hyphomicrobiales bacterium]
MEEGQQQREPLQEIYGIVTALGKIGISITMSIRYWARTTALFQTRHAMNARIREALNAYRIALTYPQREVPVLQ